MGLAVGGRTLKMKFGHHGANHPVLDVETKKVYITSQNHGFAVDERTAGERQGHARLALRRFAAGLPTDRCTGVLLPGASGGEPGAARHPRSLRSLHRGDGGADHTGGIGVSDAQGPSQASSHRSAQQEVPISDVAAVRSALQEARAVLRACLPTV
jgi:hypothetical protein